MSRHVAHVYPRAGRTHVVDGSRGADGWCWCRPVVKRLCPQCGGDPAGCWRCDEGLVDAGSVSPGDRVIVVHNEF